MSCIICGCSQIEEIKRVEKFPIFMGATVFPTPDCGKSDMTYGTCQSCQQLQVVERIPVEVLYAENHNVDTVGKLWNEHFDRFAKFIVKNFDLKKGNIIDIGDPSAKIASRLHKAAKQWTIVEPNPAIESFDNVRIIKGFFPVPLPQGACVIHSHVFEHQYNPIKFLQDCRSALSDDGVMIFTLPNMSKIMDFAIPPTIMNFEHIYYLDEATITYLLRKTGFEVVDVEAFDNHSIFFAARKINYVTDVRPVTNNLLRFRQAVQEFDEHTGRISQRIKGADREVCVFGCHVTTQYLLATSDGIKHRIGCVLDNAPSKQGKYLNGTTLLVRPPSYVKDKKVAVVTSHSGIYGTEIEQQLKSINPAVIFT